MAEPMSYSTVFKVYDIFLKAFASDPIQLYLWEDLSACPLWTTWLRQTARRFRLASTAAFALQTGLAFQVDGGNGYVLATYAKADSSPPDTVVNAVSRLATVIGKTYDLLVWPVLSTRQQRHRADEIKSKIEATESRVLGDDASQYMYLSHLVCAPESQGKGLGKALVKAVTDVADVKQRKVWLLSGNIRNNRFYRSCGFEVVDEIALDSSPPVVVQTMMYEPRKD